AQDTGFSSRQRGFETPRGRQTEGPRIGRCGGFFSSVLFLPFTWSRTRAAQAGAQSACRYGTPGQEMGEDNGLPRGGAGRSSDLLEAGVVTLRRPGVELARAA